MRLHWASDEKVVIGVGQSHAFGLGRLKKREVRVGAKWLHGLKGESKTGGSGSAGILTFSAADASHHSLVMVSSSGGHD
jgi:hypothetical protein